MKEIRCVYVDRFVWRNGEVAASDKHGDWHSDSNAVGNILTEWTIKSLSAPDNSFVKFLL